MSSGGPGDAAAESVLGEARRSLLRAVLNEIVPPRADLAGAGDLGVGVEIEHTLTAAPRLRRLFLDGLSELAVVRFLDLPPAGRVDALRRIEREHPIFFSALVEHAYRGYYTLPEVHAAIKYSGPPQPRGGVLRPYDLASLARQRDRQEFWRRA
jgi:hypothetical protein